MNKIPDNVIAAAKASQKQWGVPAAISIAQWALESAWGQHMSGVNNPFGIKTLPGLTSTPKMTWEEVNGHAVKMVQNFANFKTLDDAFVQHGKLLATSHFYRPAMAQKEKPDIFAKTLTGVYATDSKYGAKLIKIMKDNNLYQYDQASV